MSTTATRTHLVLPSSLVDEIDERVGPRGRSKFVAEILEEWFRRERRVEAARRFRGSVKPGEIPEWDTAESAARWVHDGRHIRSAGERELDEGWLPAPQV